MSGDIRTTVDTYKWVVPCTLKKRRDADTFEVVAQVPGTVDIPMLGLYADISFPQVIVVRLEGVDAWEKSTAAGKLAIVFVDEWFNQQKELGQQLYLATNNKKDNFGRTLGDIRLSPSHLTGLSYELLNSAHAVPYSRERHGVW